MGYQKIFGHEPSTVLQIVFIMVILLTLCTIGIFVIRAVREQAKLLRTGMKNKNYKNMFSHYTSLEKKMLFPVLAIVWIVVKLYQCTHTSNNKTKVTPKLEKQHQSQRRLMELVKKDIPKKTK